PIEAMPPSLRAHIRYPQDLFTIQADLLRTYHMQDARVFYNKEDLWAFPTEVFTGAEQPLEPYYLIMRLPGEREAQFLLILPFTPTNKNNTIAWLAAGSDGQNYGKLVSYEFPKEKLIYGPLQIEARINQDTAVSAQFALWNQGGSRVIRGTLLMIPIEMSFLYVEPIFLQSAQGRIPELKRVIVASGERLAMEATLEEALAKVVGTTPPVVSPGPPAPTPPVVGPTGDLAQLIQSAQGHYTKAQEYLKAGDWAGYGDELKALASDLARLKDLIGQ
ncbi:MAG: UPF0182 family protein, partial [Chloroflexi bacterium]|nr:UPF0182 family protein [Chloroflexota bacterium]